MIYTLGKVDQGVLEEIEEEQRVRKTRELFLLFSLGSQFDHLIKQELEKLGVFCLVADPSRVTVTDVKKVKPTGIILSGGPVSVHQDPPPFDRKIFDLEIPVLGICLGFQLWADHIGCEIIPSDKREFGTHGLSIVDNSILFEGCQDKMSVLESHGDRIETGEGDGLSVLAKTENCSVAAGSFRHLLGVQFHPEVTETASGPQIFKNFCFKICGAKDRYPAERVAEQKISDLREKIGDKKVLLALSGGSDSSTVAYLLKEALAGKKDQLKAVYIQGVDRPDDEAYVLEFFGHQKWIDLKIVDATDRFLEAVKDQETMRQKRVAMRGIYETILKKEATGFGASFVFQGTLYTDISESGGGYKTGAVKAQIKLHHNVGLNFGEIEEVTPLSDCVKDSGRNIGRSIGVPEVLLVRHPFPGPGLLIRIEGEVAAQELKIARQVDQIYVEELRQWDLYDKVWQAGAVVTRSNTTCTKGDDAVSGAMILLWAVWSVNGFTARWARLPADFLDHVSRRITNEVREAGGVSYRISDKPPTTIEIG